MIRRGAALALAVALLPGAAGAQFYRGRSGGPPPSDVNPLALTNVRVEEKLGAQVPLDSELVDWQGRPFRLAGAFDGKRPVVLALVYYECPMLCGLMLSGLAKSMRDNGLALGKDFQAVTISFDPEETPAEAAERRRGYLQSVGLKDSPADWPFLVGRGEVTRRIADAVGFHYEKDPVSGEWAHMAALFVLTPDGKVSRYLYGIEYPPQDLKLSLLEAGGGKVGTSLDRVLLTCYRYSASSRKYEPYALGFLRLGGAVVLVALGGLVAVLAVRERRRTRRSAP